MSEIFEYILELLVGKDALPFLEYTKVPTNTKKLTIIQSNFFDDNVYGTIVTLPHTPFQFLPNTLIPNSQKQIPFLFGKNELQKTANGNFILYADLVASSYFLLTRYEEMIKPNARDMYGRFLAKDAIVFQQGFGFRPLVDEWGRYTRNLLRLLGFKIATEKKQFQKIYLTHDVDIPFLLSGKKEFIKFIVKKYIFKKKSIQNVSAYKLFKKGEGDTYNTFDTLISYDSLLKNKNQELVESIYFIIVNQKKEYANIHTKKFKNLISRLQESKAKLGIHLSHEAGVNPDTINDEVEKFKSEYKIDVVKSRNHFLRWREASDIDFFESAGIAEDFTLTYADCAGFRVGTCHPYFFINPKTKRKTTVIIHPLQIMEGSLYEKTYMHLEFDEAVTISKNIIDTVFEYSGELNLLFHNSSFIADLYVERLYKNLLDYIANLLI